MVSVPSKQFPAAWNWFVDEAVPTYVKDTYSPRESWKGKPFTKEDAHFFFRGVEELSELFTEERPRNLPNYLTHPKFRSAYTLYFLPLQAAKFLTLFELHSKAVEAALEHGKKHGKLIIADLGSGPGTASIAFLLRLLQIKPDIPPIELHWYDLNRDILADGKRLAEQLASNFPALHDKLTVITHAEQWWKASVSLPAETSLILMGHILNEVGEGRGLEENPQASRTWESLLSRARGGGMLLVEPAARRSSQHLSRLRNQLIESGLVEQTAEAIWGPCLHAEKCPLSEGRDWCHFSIPARIPGKWFLEFSKGLGSERQWVKFSYLWLSSPAARAPKPDPDLRRVISDPLSQGRTPTVLLCVPDEPDRLTSPAAGKLHRGDLYRLRKEDSATKKPSRS